MLKKKIKFKKPKRLQRIKKEKLLDQVEERWDLQLNLKGFKIDLILFNQIIQFLFLINELFSNSFY